MMWEETRFRSVDVQHGLNEEKYELMDNVYWLCSTIFSALWCRRNVKFLIDEVEFDVQRDLLFDVFCVFAWKGTLNSYEVKIKGVWRATRLLFGSILQLKEMGKCMSW
ncbi:unnamed protein product [Rhizophagus irregularis]|nr:unnamed protein product [Rhizophagus irregularis]